MEKLLTKKTFNFLFILMTLSLLVLPLTTTLDHFLTRLLNAAGGLQLVQNFIVPHEAKIVAVVLSPLGFNVLPRPDGIYVNGVVVNIWWSCIGWQSAILVVLSFWSGFSGKFTRSSKAETVILGILGFFFLTVFRLSSVAVVGGLFGTLPALIYHDYFAATILTFLYLFLFWWFAYKFILEGDFDGKNYSVKTASNTD